jgi:hypothetical protein
MPTHVLPDAPDQSDCLVCVQQAIQHWIGEIHEGDQAAWSADIPIERSSPPDLFEGIARDEFGPYRSDHIQARSILNVVFRPIDTGQCGIVTDHGREAGAGLGEHAVAQQLAVVKVLVTVDDRERAGHLPRRM